MKKLLVLILTLILFLNVTACSSSQNDDEVKNNDEKETESEEIVYSEGLEFVSNNDGTCYVKGIGTCTDSDIFIPSISSLGDTVVSIGLGAFYKESIQMIYIPDSVTTISRNAFKECKIKTINIPSSVSFIGNGAFEDCDYIESVYISDLAKWCEIEFENSDANPLGSYNAKLYINNNPIENLIIPSGVTSIGKHAFYGNDFIKEIIIPDSVTSIGAWAFAYCSNITSVSIPDSVATIGAGAFFCNMRLKSVIIGKGVTAMNGDTFNGGGFGKLENVYYRGSAEEWNSIEKFGYDIPDNAKIYYYSSTNPQTEGDFWHYDEGGDIVIW